MNILDNQKIKLLSFGEVLWDIINGQAYIGGAPFNLAAHASRCGLESYLLTRVGTDELGNRVLVEMDRLNVFRQYVQNDHKHPTGTVTVSLSASGQPSYVIHENVAWDCIDVNNNILSALVSECFDVICFGTLAQRKTIVRKSLVKVLEQLKDVPAFFDVNLRQNYYSLELLVAGLKRTTILKLNDAEVLVLSDLIFGRKMSGPEFVQILQKEFPVQVVLLTMGEKGCLVAEKGTVETLEGHRVKVADTVGAGDAFSAAFLAGWLRGKTAVEAAEMGNMLGAFVASRSGAIPEYSEEIQNNLGLMARK
ncbi:MAG: carbohydrate kinase [Kiritimatiellae bacterium]|nr:carbohydrate kinase [Kiritimatiellia bacterium]MDD5519775.1 carbohydrate kinase [Kiritimatiellia bacterium]